MLVGENARVAVLFLLAGGYSHGIALSEHRLQGCARVQRARLAAHSLHALEKALVILGPAA